ncbi:MAG: ABC transporter permease subunit [Bacillota bacterium]|nr:ABC transporter permease subunit [Bacillota bacterium]
MQKNRKTAFHMRLWRNLHTNPYLYLMAIPVVVYFIIFQYIPIYGNVIAFKQFIPAEGIWGSQWVGLKHFVDFFNSYYFFRLLRNTLLLSIYSLVFSFPLPILFALLINELRNKRFKKITQTITYIPHFISIMVVCGMVIDFTSKSGVINDLIEWFGGERKTFLLYPQNFRSIYILTGIWQETGWSSIIYLSALSAIDVSLYEAAEIDGAGRLRQTWNITLPSIMPTIIILLILRIGSMMNIGFEKIILLYNSNTYETADVISTFIYRRGILGLAYSYSSAVGLFNSIINFSLLVFANMLSRKFRGSGLF